jgi:hypothetical protein
MLLLPKTSCQKNYVFSTTNIKAEGCVRQAQTITRGTDCAVFVPSACVFLQSAQCSSNETSIKRKIKTKGS